MIKKQLKRAMLLLATLFPFISCGNTGRDSEVAAEPDAHAKIITSETDAKFSLPAGVEHEPANTFPISYGGFTLTGRLDAHGVVTILDYPSEWHGKALLVESYAPKEDGVALFSEEWCADIEKLAMLGAMCHIQKASRMSY